MIFISLAYGEVLRIRFSIIAFCTLFKNPKTCSAVFVLPFNKVKRLMNFNSSSICSTCLVLSIFLAFTVFFGGAMFDFGCVVFTSRLGTSFFKVRFGLCCSAYSLSFVKYKSIIRLIVLLPLYVSQLAPS